MLRNNFFRAFYFGGEFFDAEGADPVPGVSGGTRRPVWFSKGYRL